MNIDFKKLMKHSGFTLRVVQLIHTILCVICVYLCPSAVPFFSLELSLTWGLEQTRGIKRSYDTVWLGLNNSKECSRCRDSVILIHS